jgi:hypothetical protein
MTKIESIKEQSVKLIGKYFGQEMASLYDKFYTGKDEKTIKISINELLTDYLGKIKAEEQLKQLINGAK